MSDRELFEGLSRLAAENPPLRRAVVPLLKAASFGKQLVMGPGRLDTSVTAQVRKRKLRARSVEMATTPPE